MRLRHLRPALIVVILMARPSIAQEAGHVGLTMALPGSIGVIVPVSDRLAITSTFDFFASSGASDDASTVDVEIGARFYVRKWDGLRPYVSPRFGFSRTSFTNSD